MPEQPEQPRLHEVRYEWTTSVDVNLALHLCRLTPLSASTAGFPVPVSFHPQPSTLNPQAPSTRVHPPAHNPHTVLADFPTSDRLTLNQLFHRKNKVEMQGENKWIKKNHYSSDVCVPEIELNGSDTLAVCT